MSMNRAQKRAQDKARKKQQLQEDKLLPTAEGCNQLAIKYMASNPQRAHDLLVGAIAKQPKEDGYWINYSEVLKRLKVKKVPPSIVLLLIARLYKPSQIESFLKHIAMVCLMADKRIIHWAQLPDDQIIAKPIQHNFLFGFIENYMLANPPLEDWLTRVRKTLLLAELDKKQQKKWTPFVEAMTTLCFRNEYVFWQSQEETDKLATLDLEDEWQFLLAACYVPVDRKKQMQLEQELAKSINSLGEVNNKISQKVKAQYEENPYPRWDKIQLPASLPAAQELQRILPCHSAGFFSDISNKPNVLIGGCGTGQHALQAAARYKESEVLAVDLSFASLAYAKNKIQTYGYENKIELLQADILSLTALDKKFDIIESSGVLHHMQDPMAGWKVLKSLLKPNGMMKIALYSEAAREAIATARTVIAKEGYEANEDSIRQCRRDIMHSKLPATISNVMTMQDFYTMSECRDLLFHVQEHRFTLPQLAENMDELGVEFLGFEHQTHANRQHYAKLFPKDAKQTNLQNWHQLELKNPNMFFGMYQMWMRLKD